MRPHSAAQLERALALMRAGEFAAAEQALFAALDPNPRDHRALHGLALLDVRADRPDLAIEHARSGLAFQSEALEAWNDPRGALNLGPAGPGCAGAPGVAPAGPGALGATDD